MKTVETTTYKDAYPKNSSGIDASLDKEHSPFKVLAHPDAIKEYAAGQPVRPIHARIGLTNRCNLRCHFCNFHSENEKDFYNEFNFRDELDTEKVSRFMHEFAENGGKAVTFCGSGECTIHCGYKEICYRAKEAGLEIGLITNGAKLEEEEMRICIAQTHTWIRIGLNAGSPQTYEDVTGYKGSNYTNILDATSYLRKEAVADEFRVGLNFVITMKNYFDIVNAARDAKASGAHYIRFEPEFYSALAHETIYERLNEIVDLLNKAKAYEENGFEVSIPKIDRGAMVGTDNIEGDFTKCHYCNFVTALGADGYMYPCPQVHLNSEYRMGNVIEKGYSNWIQNGDKEKWMSSHLDRTDNCKTCFYRPQNELLEWLSNGKLDPQIVLEEYHAENKETLHKNFA